ncbi:uncharacterized protein RCO7_07062 [Rhynchosporium graminicola]|uniref:Uncharacterized protein n=1 Tax=Rhynchosporium graminicola TaxID=2792576 RepID=A0A1E1K064_9HELO|nr:uncharacterized protein RCO7_07062 [Rhynchosporium commune]
MPVSENNAQQCKISIGGCDTELSVSTIEFYLASKDPYRVVAGQDEYPTPWPYNRNCYGVSKYTRDMFHRIESAYGAVLVRYGITVLCISFESIAPLNSGSEVYIDTIVLISHDEDSSSWHLAADEVQALVDEEVLRTQPKKENRIRIELRNPTKWYRGRSSAVSPGTEEHSALLSTVETMKSKAEEACLEHLTNITWVLRCPLIPYCAKPSVPTVMVAIKPGSKGQWGHIEEQLRLALCTVSEGDVDVKLELVAGALLPNLSNGSQYSLSQVNSDHWCPPYTGASIGVRGSREAGSIGPWVHFHDKGFLTTHHVAAAHRVVSPADGPPLKRLYAEIGINRKEKKARKPPIVDYPAPLDTAQTKERYETYAKRFPDNAAKDPEDLKNMDDLYDSGGLGTVLESSGYYRKNKEGRRMDWAFIRLNVQNQHMFGENTTATGPNGTLCHTYT